MNYLLECALCAVCACFYILCRSVVAYLSVIVSDYRHSASVYIRAAQLFVRKKSQSQFIQICDPISKWQLTGSYLSVYLDHAAFTCSLIYFKTIPNALSLTRTQHKTKHTIISANRPEMRKWFSHTTQSLSLISLPHLPRSAVTYCCYGNHTPHQQFHVKTSRKDAEVSLLDGVGAAFHTLR